ncbi:hypothetical protein [Brochothrix thermosphacta]|uniref:hypothetical protein n=1 Tax=Brochothrix thermosphacta TaxID=2756 RepID=UPI000E716FB4|nr:hypothetical protein [Brochothrix thermosphacta]ANZ94885.1 hypothetical protein BFC19_05565 [Brochothrix thermosphacta]ANZ96815.1 hypothetical protein BFC20_03230 [Brochothrix thermosphacta]HCZ46751.1 hypothetical protein [Brochothrix thermosphacta]
MKNQHKFIGFTIIVLGVTIIFLPHSVQATEAFSSEDSVKINFSNKKIKEEKKDVTKGAEPHFKKIEKQLAIMQVNKMENENTETYLAGFFSALAGTVFYSE